jgi:hypothetical protein
MTAGYDYLLDSNTQDSNAEIESAVTYFDQTRLPLARWKNLHPDIVAEVAFSELTFPTGYRLVKRNDSRFFVDANGIYITFDQPPKGLANVLMKKYSVDNGNSKVPWRLGYYHVGIKDPGGCLVSVTDYIEESVPQSKCYRLLPGQIKIGALVITDRDAKK